MISRDVHDPLERLAVLVEVRQRLAGHARLHRRFRDRRRHAEQHARVERLRDQVVAAEREAPQLVGRQHRLGTSSFARAASACAAAIFISSLIALARTSSARGR